ncbi:MAG: glycosyltransferase family 2 protein [Endomicrobiales bacterium]|nr:glycosyltransferase family 2 protein [Endomicrobiales bacterium]
MDRKTNDLTVVVPAYNEEQGIRKVLNDLKEVLDENLKRYEIIVVNDGSRDRTGEIASETGVTVISHPINVGYGQAIITGVEKAKYETIAIIDADGSYPPSELTKLLAHAPDFDMVIGARKGRHFWGSMFKSPARLIFLWLSEYATGQNIPDANSGLRIFKKNSIPNDPLFCRGFSFSTTLTLMFISTGKFVKFVPIEYVERQGKSKIRIIRDTLRVSQVLVESLLYYNPLKLVLPFCLMPFVSFAAVHVAKVSGMSNFGLAYLIWLLIVVNASVGLFMMGLVIDIIRLKK